MYAIELLNTTEPEYFMRLSNLKQVISKEDIARTITHITNLYSIIDEYMITQNFNVEKYLNFINQIHDSNINEVQKRPYYYLMNNPFNFILSTNLFRLFDFSYCLYNDKSQLLDFSGLMVKSFANNDNIYKKILTYTVIYKYIISNYTLEELLNIFNILHLNYSELDIINLDNDDYWLKEILLADIKNYFSEDFNNFLYNLINKG
jgi:hypothetical protein